MIEPNWISYLEVEAIHQGMIEIGGGSHGLRDFTLLESALARPQNQFAYGEEDIFALAASYAESIAKNHAFVDGNKRTAFGAAVIFLEINGYSLNKAEGIEHAVMMENLAQGNIKREEAADYLRDHSQAIL